MSSQKKIILFTIGNIDHPSSRIRGIQYIPYFEEAGYRVKWIPRIPPKPKNKFDKYFVFPILKRWYSLIRNYHLVFSKPDYFFIQKIFISKKLLQKAKNGYSKIIFDFDDAIYLDKNNSKAKQSTDTMIRFADKVVVSNDILKNYSKGINPNTTIITTPIDTKRIFPNKVINNKPFTIGWIGSYWTTPYLKIVEEALKTLSTKYSIKLLLVGADESYNIEGVEVEHHTWMFDKELEEINLFDIGIMPLTSDEYSNAKGGYKLLMYLAAGIPQIASPVGINKNIIIENKTGFLAKTTKDWVNHISYLIENNDKCLEFSKESRKLAVSKYSREICFSIMKDVL